MTYTGHKNKHMINGENIVDWVMHGVIRESKLHGGVPIPSRKQVAIVIRAMRMFHLIEYAANYNFPELKEPDNTAKFYPAIISICKFFRDAPLEVLEKYEIEHRDN